MLPLLVAFVLASTNVNGSTVSTNRSDTYPATEQATSTLAFKSFIATNTPETSELSFTSLKTLIRHYSELQRVSYDTMYSIVDCETGHTFNPLIQSFAYWHGIREDSWGLVQINLPSWPDITKAQAQDPNFSLNFLGEKLSQGKGYLWSCYRLLALKT